MYAFFGGSIRRLVPENLKTGVLWHPREGEVLLADANREMATHYSAAVPPGRVRHPRDYPGDSVIPSLGGRPFALPIFVGSYSG